jgi:hypothetical protein
MSSTKATDRRHPDSAENNPSREEFGRMFMARLQQAGMTEELVFSRDEFSVRLKHSDEPARDAWVVRLENTYQDFFLAPPGQRDEVVARLVRIAMLPPDATPPDFETAAPDLLPAVRCRTGYEIDLLRARIQGEAYTGSAQEPLAVHLGVRVAYSLPDAIMGLGPKEFAKWNVTAEQAMQAAMGHLAALSHPFGRARGCRGVFYCAANDGYDSSRMLLPHLCEAVPVRGNHIAMVPATSHLLLAGDNDPKALEIMVGEAEAAFGLPQGLSGYAFRLIDGEWRPWLPPKSHVLYPRFRALQLVTAYQAYRAQHDLLVAQEQSKPAGESCFVAGYGFEAGKSNLPERSAVAWTQGVPTLLPQVDAVYFVQGNVDRGLRPVARVAWDRVLDVMGDRMEPLGLYPERYRVRCFPTDGELARLMSA